VTRTGAPDRSAHAPGRGRACRRRGVSPRPPQPLPSPERPQETPLARGRWTAARRRRVAVAAAVAGLVLVVVLGRLPGWSTASALLYSAMAVGGVVLVVVGGLRTSTGRAPWLLLAAGAGILVGGQLTLMWLVDEYDAARSPQVWLEGLRTHVGAFSLGLVAYPLLYAAQMALLRQRVERLLPSAWLDGVIATVAVTAMSLAFLVPALGETLGLGVAGALVLTARPLLDMIMAAFALANWGLSGWRADRRLPLVLATMATLCASDVAGALHVAGVLEGAGVGPAVDTGRLAALVLLAVASAQPASPARGARVETFGLVATPVVGLAFGVALLALDGVRPLPDAAVHLVLVALSLVGLKLLLVIREVLVLADSRRLAMTDDLTGLANRRALHRALDAATGGQRRAALLMLDLDRFKEVNDSYGHAVGDALLRSTARRVGEHLPPTALLARLGGDEFAVLLPATGLDEATAVARAAVVAAAEPDVVGGRTLRAVASVGVAATPDEAGSDLDAEELLRRADAAMFLAKRSGAEGAGATGVYDEAVDAERRARRQLLEELRATVDEAPGAGEVLVHYQPQVAAATGAAVGVEALVRWRHPRRGVLAPGAFLDLAEEHGLMADVTTRVLRQAVEDAVRWRERGHELRVSVNLSTSCLLNPALLPLVDEVLAESGLAPEALVLEITETALMRDPVVAVRTAERLAARGVGLSIDDYGTGYASMAYLDDLPATELKLDRGFTARLLEGGRTAAIVRTTVDLAHRLGMRLVAEGVEDDATLGALHELGCDETQGYLHSRPLAAEDLTRWLDERAAASPVPRPRAGEVLPSSRQPGGSRPVDQTGRASGASSAAATSRA